MNPNPKGTKKANVIIVPPDQIANLLELPQVRFRPLNEMHAESLAYLIAREGQKTPLVGRYLGGLIQVCAGRHRKAAFERINSDPEKYGADGPIGLEIKILALTDDEAFDVGVSENLDRLGANIMDLAYAAAKWQNRGMQVKVIAQRLSSTDRKISPSRVVQLVSLMSLPRDVQELIHDGKLPESVARQILRKEEHPDEIIRLANAIVAKEVTAAAITAEANDKRRAAGKEIARNRNEIIAALEASKSDGAVDLLGWIRGEIATFPEGVFRE